MALGEDGFTMFWLYDYIKVEGRTWPSTAFHVRKFFIEPIEDEL